MTNIKGKTYLKISEEICFKMLELEHETVHVTIALLFDGLRHPLLFCALGKLILYQASPLCSLDSATACCVPAFALWSRADS